MVEESDIESGKINYWFFN